MEQSDVFNIYVRQEISSAKGDNVRQTIHSFTFPRLCNLK